ncbi:MAG: 3-oxoacyl-[acyl-carrier-protein] reductase [Bacillota bacterium]
MLLDAKTAVITGASRGIGRAVALALAREGAAVCLNYRGNEASARETQAEVERLGGKAVLVQADISREDEVARLFHTAVSELGTVDILVNNAGVTLDRLVLRMKESDWNAVISTNLTGAFLCCREAIRLMLKKKSGSIVNISSVVALTGNAGQCNYAAAKAGLLGLTRSLAHEVGSRGIRVNAVAPGLIATDMTKELPQEARDRMIAATALKREGNPEEVADAVLFLVSDLSRYITGQVIGVDGGLAYV